MGRPRKVIEGEPEIMPEAGDMLEYGDEPAQPASSDERAAYIKNGVTILRPLADGKALAADGWERK